MKAVEGACSPSGGSNPSPSVNLLNQLVFQVLKKLFSKVSQKEAQEEHKPLEDTTEAPKKKNLFERFKEGLSKTKEKLTSALSEVFEVDRLVDLNLLEELEEKLILADLGVETTLHLLEPFKNKVIKGEPLTTKELKRQLKEKMLELLIEYEKPFPPSEKPSILFFLGVNGVGKTTTIAKLAKRFKEDGKEVLLVAGDTFRAAAIDQLKMWGERLGLEVSHQKEGSDPSAVIYQGLEKAIKENKDLVLVDTAGRLHTKYNLMEELKKMNRVMDKLVPKENRVNILVLDATTGQNAISQAEHFSKAIPLSALIITKMDGTAKGGIALAVSYKFKLPILFIGLGEKAEDLLPFDKHAFINAILPD
ncbi:signal recognition particle-docking protein FtsY [Caldimicrobium thiodismutans]|uniref:Signal recognition particle receptor FtsY n=1 Tax=Caldimicrobium thiodismutans TaxID=1653476 RepID=A0A0U4N2F4_9BACT|nr:signal recognition particle-docking protein FtsY [Caldimicrobium thiodismutans]